MSLAGVIPSLCRKYGRAASGHRFITRTWLPIAHYLTVFTFHRRASRGPTKEIIMTNQTLMSASSLSGDDVKNAQGESLGHVKDIMIDTQNNRVAYYVLSFGGLFGVGDTLFAIPPEAMELNTKDQCLILNIDKDRLKKSEGFDKDHWPNMADPTFRTHLYRHYGITDRFAA